MIYLQIDLRRDGKSMAKFHFDNARISGLSVCLGENLLNFDEQPYYYHDNAIFLRRMKKIFGFGHRYKAGEDTTSADLCYCSARRLLSEMHVDSASIDAIISITQTPDYHMPGNAHVLHEKLVLPKNCLALDVTLGCSGFVYGLFLAYSMIASGSNRVLVVLGDTLSKVINPKDRAEAPLFTDSGSACIVERSTTETESFFILRSDGKGMQNMIQRAGAYRIPSSEDTKVETEDKDGNVRTLENLYVNGKEVLGFTGTEQPLLTRDLLEFAGRKAEDVDYFIFQQANKYVVETLARFLGLSKDKVPCNFPDYGNLSSGSIPGTLCSMTKDKEPKGHFVLQGFGIGYSWGTCLLELKPSIVLPPFLYSSA